MYERFFGLDELPFQLTPDPRYLFLSSKHREALAHLVYGIREGAGFVCITGEIGAGKTTLLRAMLREADEATQYAYILNPVLTGVELLQEINHELGLPASGARRELLVALNQALLDHKAAGRRVVLVIDEAQALDGAILEQLRLLSNFETETAKLLQIVLVGQPELRDILGRPDLEQLDQRVTVRWHLGRLDASETEQYISHRVATAGQTRRLFTRGAMSLIHGHSRGVPRLVNVLCHRALLVAYASDEPRVTRPVVRRAIGELRRHLPVHVVRRDRRWLWAGGAGGAAAAAILAGVVLWRGLAEQGSLMARVARERIAAVTSPGVPARAVGDAQVAPPADAAGPAAHGPARFASGPSEAAPVAPVDEAAAAAVAQAPTGGPLHEAPAAAAAGLAGEPAAGSAAHLAPAASASAASALPDAAGAIAASGTSGASGVPGSSGEPTGPGMLAGAVGSEIPGVAADSSPAAPDDAAVLPEDPLVIERASFAEAMRQTTAGNSAYEATEALLRSWAVAQLSAREAASPTLDLQSIGRARGLEYLSFSGNMNLLRVLDLPAILEVAPEDGSASRFVTLTHLDDQLSRVVIGAQAIEIAPPVLTEAWFGKAHLFWKDLDRLGGVLSAGSARNEVRRLHALLRGVGAYEGPDAPVFGPATENAVLRFQRGKRLFADGKAGPMTMITLYQSVADERVPRLSGGPGAARSERAQAWLGEGGGRN